MPRDGPVTIGGVLPASAGIDAERATVAPTAHVASIDTGLRPRGTRLGRAIAASLLVHAIVLAPLAGHLMARVDRPRGDATALLVSLAPSHGSAHAGAMVPAVAPVASVANGASLVPVVTHSAAATTSTSVAAPRVIAAPARATAATLLALPKPATDGNAGVVAPPIAPRPQGQRPSDADVRPVPYAASASDHAGLPVQPTVEAQVADTGQLGPDLALRAATEFPAEVSYPVRLHDPVVAQYPTGAREAGIEGTVLVWAVLDANGAIEELSAVSGPDALAEAALDAVRSGRFQPAARNGEGVRYPIALTFEFRLPEDGRAAQAAVAASVTDATSVTGATP